MGRIYFGLLMPVLASCALPPEVESLPAVAPTLGRSSVEVITKEAAFVQDGVQNAWGGHQPRVVRTNDGVFTAYIVTKTPDTCEWRLAHRKGDGTWPVIATGPCKNEAVNLLATPDGTLHVIAWNGVELIDNVGVPQGSEITMKASLIEIPQGAWAYGAAGASERGDLCISASEGGNDEHGRILLVHRPHGSDQWTSSVLETHFRHCYTYLHPLANGGLVFSSSRDTLWTSLTDPLLPKNAEGYAFNAFTLWKTDNLASTPTTELYHDEEPPVSGYIYPSLNPQIDSYLDTEGRVHLIYLKECKSTNGTMQVRHRIVSAEGKMEHDAELPECAARFNRMLQDDAGDYYLLSSNGFLLPMSDRGTKPGEPIKLELGDHKVAYSGFSITAPRTGTARSDILDVVFTDQTPGSWLYLEIKLPKAIKTPSSSPQQ